jgi:hypothetical protein
VNLNAGGRGRPRREEEEGVTAAGGKGDVVVAAGPLETAKEGDGDDKATTTRGWDVILLRMDGPPMLNFGGGRGCC